MATHTINGTITCGVSGGSVGNNWNGCYQNTASKNNRYAGKASGESVWYASNIMYGTGLDSLRNKTITSITMHINVSLGTVWPNTDAKKWNIGFKYTSSNGANATSGTLHWARTSNAAQTAMGTYAVAYLTSNYSSGSGWYDVPLGTTLPKYGYCIGPTAGYTSQTRLKFGTTTTLIVVVPDYTINYNKGSYGTGTNTSDTVESGDSTTLPGAIFTRTGYTQTGWSTNSNGSTKDYNLSASYTATATVTLYPYWTPNVLTILYQANGGTMADTHGSEYALDSNGYVTRNGVRGFHTINYDSSDDPYNYNDPNKTNLIRTGYIGKSGAEWNTSADGTGTSFSQTTSCTALTYCPSLSSGNQTITLYVNWEASSIIHIKYNGAVYDCPVYIKHNGTLYLGIVYTKQNGTMYSTL